MKQRGEIMRFNLLGPLEITTDDARTIRLSTPKVCQVLALLLMRPNEIVSVDALLMELWGDAPPRSAVTTLQTYIYHARRIFAREGLGPADWELLITRPPGYLIRVADHEVDATVFTQLTKQGRTLLEEGQLDEASRTLRTALDLWRGGALGNIPAGDVLKGQITHLEELKIMAIELRIEAEKRLGHYRELIPELRALVSTYPLNEWFHAQLIVALNRSGRRAEAVQSYHHLRRVLDDELGLLPTPEIQELQHELLNAGHRPRPTHSSAAYFDFSTPSS
jgi:DNA-binding SARP family transcriptional activator